jgi:hypothetical protein
MNIKARHLQELRRRSSIVARLVADVTNLRLRLAWMSRRAELARAHFHKPLISRKRIKLLVLIGLIQMVAKERDER